MRSCYHLIRKYGSGRVGHNADDSTSRGKSASAASPDLAKFSTRKHAGNGVHAVMPFGANGFTVNRHFAVHAKHAAVKYRAGGFSNSSRGNRYRGHGFSFFYFFIKRPCCAILQFMSGDVRRDGCGELI